MHDARGNELKVGDIVLLPARITQLGSTSDYCNVSLESLLGRRPDKATESVHAINTGVLLRANDDDLVDAVGFLVEIPPK